MNGLIINHTNVNPKETIAFFKNCDVVSCHDFNLNESNKYDYFILTGGHINISGVDDLKEEKLFLKNTNKPIFGICLGLQILSIIDGEKLECGKVIRNGKHRLVFNDKNLNLHYEHYCRISKIPPSYNGYVKNGILEWIKHKEKPIIAFQCHPEKSGKSGEFLKNYFFNMFFNSSTNL
jgi:GMP synthase (glutamine-hydrolysing)